MAGDRKDVLHIEREEYRVLLGLYHAALSEERSSLSPHVRNALIVVEAFYAEERRQWREARERGEAGGK